MKGLVLWCYFYYFIFCFLFFTYVNVNHEKFKKYCVMVYFLNVERKCTFYWANQGVCVRWARWRPPTCAWPGSRVCGARAAWRESPSSMTTSPLKSRSFHSPGTSSIHCWKASFYRSRFKIRRIRFFSSCLKFSSRISQYCWEYKFCEQLDEV